MSVDIDWKSLTDGPDGHALAETIRDFIHERFQQIPFPKLIRSVKVHTFDFGTIAPDVVLKDICDPLPDFYETETGDSESGDGQQDEPQAEPSAEATQRTNKTVKEASDILRQARKEAPARAGSPPFGRKNPPSMLGATSNLGYFHHPLSAGLSGSATPLAAVAGAQFQHGPLSPPVEHHEHHHSDSFSSSVSSAQPDSPPPGESGFFGSRHASAVIDDDAGTETNLPDMPPDRSPEDLQVVFHAKYAGDIKLTMTAEVFLDYPMPSFVGIPLKLNITGITFDGVGILAYIKKRAHLCFLSPEDAHALVGDPFDGQHREADSANGNKVGGLFEDIRIETEMGETDSGKQVLKNVGKIEKFVLEQVRRIFEEEFVYPSFWTFLV